MATKAKGARSTPEEKKPRAKKEPAAPAPAPAQDTRRLATRVAAGALRSALKDVLGAIEGRNTIPILANVRIDASERSLVLTGTDLDMWIARTLAADPEGDWRGFATTLPAKPLERLLAELPAETPVTIAAPCEAHPGRVLLTAGRSRFLLAPLPVDDMPEPAPFTGEAGFELPCSVLADALAAVSHAISTEETRYYLNGVYVHPHGADEANLLRFAATDGHRLARVQVPMIAGLGDLPVAIWSRKTVAMLAQLLGAAAKTGTAEDPAMVLVESNAAGTVLRFQLPAADGGEALLTAKAIDGTFPDYTRVIPFNPGRRVVVSRELLATAVRRAAALSSEKTRAVSLTFSAGKVATKVTSPDLGEASDEEPCLFEGDEATLGVNAPYLLQALAAFATDEVALGFDDPVAPVLLTAVGSGDKEIDRDRLVQVLMPMRV